MCLRNVLTSLNFSNWEGCFKHTSSLPLSSICCLDRFYSHEMDLGWGIGERGGVLPFCTPLVYSLGP